MARHRPRRSRDGYTDPVVRWRWDGLRAQASYSSAMDGVSVFFAVLDDTRHFVESVTPTTATRARTGVSYLHIDMPAHHPSMRHASTVSALSLHVPSVIQCTYAAVLHFCRQEHLAHKTHFYLICSRNGIIGVLLPASCASSPLPPYCCT